MADVVHRVVGRTVASTSNVDELRWDGYFVVDEGTRELVEARVRSKGLPRKRGLLRSPISPTQSLRGEVL